MMKKYKKIGILLFYLMAIPQLFGKCKKIDSIKQMLSYSKEKNLNYVVIIGSLLPGKKNVKDVHFTPRNQDCLKGRNKVSVQRFSPDNILIGGSPKDVPHYVRLGRFSKERKQSLIYGFVNKSGAIPYVEHDFYCGPQLWLEDGKIKGYITLDSKESKRTPQAMTVQKFKKYFEKRKENILEVSNKKLKSRNIPQGKSKRETIRLKNAIRLIDIEDPCQ